MDFLELVRDIKKTWGRDLQGDELQDAIVYTLERAGALSPTLDRGTKRAAAQIFFCCC